MANSLRLEIIKGYLATVNFAGDDWSYHIIEEDLKTKLGERPTLNIKRKKDVMLSEDMKKSVEIEKIESIDIIYTDDDNRIKKYTILI